MPNHLINEKSPYLLQHAHNPVDWYPWGDAAFEKARQEDKPILVSIGYSTCHWCHVMERESFENPEIGELMNQHFVNIKVDREERPDIDKIYMTAVQAMTGSGGWPLNVFLTHDLQPFFGGTYFPPAAKWGHPGWPDVLQQLSSAWKDGDERKKILEAGYSMTNALKQYAESTAPPVEGKTEWLDAAAKALREIYDTARGGFGHAPKFPMPVYHHFLMRYYAQRPASAKEALEMSLHTLREMAKGGIYDHIGGGFARYSTDANWHIPHFEKMLYDNAQLAVNYLEAYQISQDPEFARVARETLDYVLRDMTNPSGGFYSAEDADSLPTADSKEKVEGAFYVWEKKEIQDELFCFRYGVREGGNAAQDPHGEFKNKNILYEAHPLAEAAREFKLSPEEARTQLDQAKAKLFETRAKRPRPHLDDKILSAWNGLMISAFAKGYQILGDTRYLQAAEKAAWFLHDRLFDASKGLLYRRWRDGDRQTPGIADDYAFVIQALLDLYEAGFDAGWLAWAEELTRTLNQRFYDTTRGGYFMTATDQDPNLLVRFKEDQDNVEPSASSVAALNLLRLAQFTDNAHYREKALRTLQAFGTTLQSSPRAMPFMMAALDYALSDPKQIVIAGTPGAPDTQELLKPLKRHFIPVKIVLFSSTQTGQTGMSKLPSFINGMKPQNGKATAYVCKHYACQAPTTDPIEFERQIQLE